MTSRVELLLVIRPRVLARCLLVYLYPAYNMPGSFIQSFTHLKDRPKSDRALPMLQRIASLVKPIMRKHGWNLPVLAEFFPESPNLLGE
jgi:hypothetical protein